MTQVLDAIDERIGAAEEDVTRAKDVIGSARELRLRLEGERQQARGGLARGDVATLVNLDRLAEEILGARRAEQDAQSALDVAHAAVPPLRKEREKAEAEEIRARLAPLMDVRAALATKFEAQLSELAALAALYRTTVAETVALGNLLGVPTGGHLHQHVDMVIATAPAAGPPARAHGGVQPPAHLPGTADGCGRCGGDEGDARAAGRARSAGGVSRSMRPAPSRAGVPRARGLVVTRVVQLLPRGRQRAGTLCRRQAGHRAKTA